MTREERRAKERAERANAKRERKEAKKKSIIEAKELKRFVKCIKKTKLERNSQAKNVEVVIYPKWTQKKIGTL